MSIAFTPFELFYLKVPISLLSIIGLLFISLIVFLVGWVGLLKTNNPLTRYNLFSMNPHFKNKMEHSISEDPSSFFRIDEATDNEKKQFNRDKKINKILK